MVSDSKSRKRILTSFFSKPICSLQCLTLYHVILLYYIENTLQMVET